MVIQKTLDNKKLKIKYKQDFERFLFSIFDFRIVDKQFNGFLVEIPKIQKNGNFYFETSILPSEYLYLRNNIYLENLSTKDIVYLKECLYKNEPLSNEFLKSTFKRVLFENSNTVMLGTSREENIVNGKGLIFELGYDQKKFTDLSQLSFIKNYTSELRKQLELAFQTQLECKVTLHEYNCIPDLYCSEDNNLKIS